MCVGVVAWRADPRWLLVAAANRDEFHERPTDPLAVWTDDGSIIAGRDRTAGGTWLGVSPTGRFAFVTNHRVAEERPPKLSRGQLVVDWLGGLAPAAPERLNPFNLIMVEGNKSGRFITNEPAVIERPLDPGIHGLSNGPIDEPWPKTLKLDRALRAFLGESQADPAALFDALRDESLPDDVPPVGGPAFPAIFVRNPHYGTRASTVVAIAADGAGWIEERRFDADANETGRTRIAFRWPG